MCKLPFADDIDDMGVSDGEHQDLTNRLVDRATAYRMEVSTEKCKIMINSTSNIGADISTCARMAPAQKKSASELSEQW